MGPTWRGVSIQIVQAMEDSAELRRCIQEIAEVMLQRGVSYARPVSKRGETMGKLWGNYGIYGYIYIWHVNVFVFLAVDTDVWRMLHYVTEVAIAEDIRWWSCANQR